jgi:hypothetical protein
MLGEPAGGSPDPGSLAGPHSLHGMYRGISGLPAVFPSLYPSCNDSAHNSGSPVEANRSHERQVAFPSRKSHLAQYRKCLIINWRTALRTPDSLRCGVILNADRRALVDTVRCELCAGHFVCLPPFIEGSVPYGETGRLTSRRALHPGAEQRFCGSPSHQDLFGPQSVPFV